MNYITNMLNLNKPLSHKEQLELLTQYSKNKDSKIRDKLVLSNYRLVYKFAKKFSGYIKDTSELIQEGIIGLIEAINRFDLSKNVHPSTYFSYWILAYMYKFILSNVGMISIKKDQHEKLFFNLRKYQDKIGINNNFTEKDLQEVTEIQNTKYYSDINYNPGEESNLDNGKGQFIKSYLPSPEDCVQIKIDFDKIKKSLLKDISPKYINVLNKRILTDSPETFEVISNDMKISKQRVQQIEAILYQKIDKLLDR